jgi:hypothetical protein
VAAGVFVIGLLDALELRVKTPEGDLVFSALPEQSVVTVDGKVSTVEWPGGKSPAIVTAPAGDHRVKVELNGIEVYGEEVSIETGKKKWITLRLDSLTALRPGKDESPASSAELREAVVTRSPADVTPQPARRGHSGGDSIITNSGIFTDLGRYHRVPSSAWKSPGYLPPRAAACRSGDSAPSTTIGAVKPVQRSAARKVVVFQCP